MSGPRHPTHPHLDGAMWGGPQFHNCTLCRSFPCQCPGLMRQANPAADRPHEFLVPQAASRLSDADVDRIARRVVEMLKDRLPLRVHRVAAPPLVIPDDDYTGPLCSHDMVPSSCGYCRDNGIRHDEGEG